jgi:hypothetical protein
MAGRREESIDSFGRRNGRKMGGSEAAQEEAEDKGGKHSSLAGSGDSSFGLF